MVQSIYIDACILIGCIEGKYRRKNDIHRISQDAIRKIESMARHNSEIKVKIPTIVLSEFMLWCIKNDEDDRVLSDLKTLVKNLKADFPSPKKEHYELAKRFIETDSRFESHDALIISHALLDPTTTWLLTTDTVLHNNKIIEKEKTERNNRFKISDCIG